jgi:putative endonuclease
MKYYYVYILANKMNGTLYTGVTNNLLRRVYEHKHKLADGFTKKYEVDKLVYFIQTDSIHSAIQREKQIKKWLRKWKIELIEEMNPMWKDLYYEYGGTDNLFDDYFKEKKILKDVHGEYDNRV